MSGIYVISKVRYGDMWRMHRDENKLDIISTWIDAAEIEIDQIDFTTEWPIYLEQAAQCDVAVVYLARGEQLKGGWCEVGAALSNGVPVYVVSDEDYTIYNHPGVTRFSRLNEALLEAQETVDMNFMKRR